MRPRIQSRFREGMSHCQRIQKHIGHVSIHPVGVTLQGPPSIEVEMPVELIENIDADNASKVERLLSDFYEGLTGLLGEKA